MIKKHGINKEKSYKGRQKGNRSEKQSIWPNKKQINMWCHLFLLLDGIQQKLCGGNIVGVKTFNVDQQLSNIPAGNVAKQ